MASPYDAWRNTYGMPGPQDPRRVDEITSAPAPRWEELLRGSDVSAIKQSPIMQAIGRYLSRPNAGVGEKTPLSPIDGRPMAPEPTALDGLPPTVQEGIGGLGLLANFLAPGVKLPPTAKPTGIRAYHGSPHDFDKFDMSKIGTGEGAQAYGHGLYFAEAENVANNYRTALSKRQDVKYGGVTPSDNATVVLKRNEYDVERAIADLAEARKTAEGWRDERMMQTIDRDMAELQGLRGKPVELPGRMYEVNINADPERFLDWDKPIDKQPKQIVELVRDALKAQGYLRKNDNGPRQLTSALKSWKTQYGGMAESPMESLLGQRGALLGETPEAMTAKLREAGIPGIRYKDALSRGADGGTSNYVVFDDSLIQILRKYGLLPPAAAAGASMLDQQEPPL